MSNEGCEWAPDVRLHKSQDARRIADWGHRIRIKRGTRLKLNLGRRSLTRADRPERESPNPDDEQGVELGGRGGMVGPIWSAPTCMRLRMACQPWYGVVGGWLKSC